MKRILSLLLTLVIVFALAACKKTPTPQPGQTTTQNNSETITKNPADTTIISPDEPTDGTEAEPTSEVAPSETQSEDQRDVVSDPTSEQATENATEDVSEEPSADPAFMWESKELGLRFVAPESFEKSTELEGEIADLSNSFSGIAGIKVEAPVIAESIKYDARIYMITMSTSFPFEAFFPDGITEDLLKETFDKKVAENPEMKYEFKKVTFAGKTYTATQMSSNGILADSNLTLDMVYDVRGKSIVMFMFVYNEGTNPTYLYNSFSAIR